MIEVRDEKRMVTPGTWRGFLSEKTNQKMTIWSCIIWTGLHYYSCQDCLKKYMWSYPRTWQLSLWIFDFDSLLIWNVWRNTHINIILVSVMGVFTWYLWLTLYSRESWICLFNLYSYLATYIRIIHVSGEPAGLFALKINCNKEPFSDFSDSLTLSEHMHKSFSNTGPIIKYAISLDWLQASRQLIRVNFSIAFPSMCLQVCPLASAVATLSELLWLSISVCHPQHIFISQRTSKQSLGAGFLPHNFHVKY